MKGLGPGFRMTGPLRATSSIHRRWGVSESPDKPDKSGGGGGKWWYAGDDVGPDRRTRLRLRRGSRFAGARPRRRWIRTLVTVRKHRAGVLSYRGKIGSEGRTEQAREQTSTSRPHSASMRTRYRIGRLRPVSDRLVMIRTGSRAILGYRLILCAPRNDERRKTCINLGGCRITGQEPPAGGS